MLSEEPFQPSCRRPSLPDRPGPARPGPTRPSSTIFSRGGPSHLDHYLVSHPTAFWELVEHYCDAAEKRKEPPGAHNHREAVRLREGKVVIVRVFFFSLSLCFVFDALWLCIYMYEWNKDVCACVSFLASMCTLDLLSQRGNDAFYVTGSAVSYFHI